MTIQIINNKNKDKHYKHVLWPLMPKTRNILRLHTSHIILQMSYFRRHIADAVIFKTAYFRRHIADDICQTLYFRRHIAYIIFHTSHLRRRISDVILQTSYFRRHISDVILQTFEHSGYFHATHQRLPSSFTCIIC